MIKSVLSAIIGLLLLVGVYFLVQHEVPQAIQEDAFSFEQYGSVLVYADGVWGVDAQEHCAREGGVISMCAPSVCRTQNGIPECSSDCSTVCLLVPTTISFIEPSGEQRWQLDGVKNITWDSEYVEGIDALVLELHGPVNGVIGVLHKDAISKGERLWKVGTVLEQRLHKKPQIGEYFISAKLYEGEVCVLHDCKERGGRLIAEAISPYFTIKE